MIQTIQQTATAITQAHPDRLTIGAYAAHLQRLSRVTPAVKDALAKAKTVRRGHTTIFYIAGGLTGMDERTKQRYFDLAELIASNNGMFGYAPHLHGTDPVKHPTVTPQEVRDIDYLWAAIVPDAHFNFWHPIAHGNAVEAGWAEQVGVPSVHIMPKDFVASRLVRGMHHIADTVTYTNFAKDGMPKIAKLLGAVAATK